MVKISQVARQLNQEDFMSNENPLLNNNSVQGAAKSIEGLMDSLKVSENSVRSLWKYKKQFLA